MVRSTRLLAAAVVLAALLLAAAPTASAAAWTDDPTTAQLCDVDPAQCVNAYGSPDNLPGDPLSGWVVFAAVVGAVVLYGAARGT